MGAGRRCSLRGVEAWYEGGEGEGGEGVLQTSIASSSSSMSMSSSPAAHCAYTGYAGRYDALELTAEMADGSGAIMSDSSTIDRLGCLERDDANPGVTGVGGMLVHVDDDPEDEADDEDEDDGDDRLSDVAGCRNRGVRGGVSGPLAYDGAARCCRGVVGVGGTGSAVAE